MYRTYSPYSDPDEVTTAVEAGLHRELVGGLWDELGDFQLKLLTRYGLSSEHYLLDIGCGSLRGGIHFVRYLNSSHYFGSDLSPALLNAGYERELMPLGLDAKLPRSNLITDSQFKFHKFNQTFERALALSVFTHLPLNSLRICLENLSNVMQPGGIFHATFFELPEYKRTSSEFEHAPAGIITHGDADPYHYRYSDLEFAARGLPWRVKYEGEVGHPRGQRLANFIRVT